MGETEEEGMVLTFICFAYNLRIIITKLILYSDYLVSGSVLGILK